MARPRDEQCPKRGPGLWHTVDGGWDCLHCGETTFSRSDAPGLLAFLEQLRAPQVRLVSVTKSCEVCHKNPVVKRERMCADCIFHRKVMFQRFRYEAGELTEEAEYEPLVERPMGEALGIGSLDDWLAESIKLAVG
jgi:hypothetical protein